MAEDLIRVVEASEGGGSTVPCPERGRVVVAWCRAADAVARVSEVELGLSAAERERAARFRVEDGRNEFMAGRWLVRSTLARWRGVKPREIELTLTPWGRPGVRKPAENGNGNGSEGGGEGDGLDFSIAHAAGYAAVAFTRGRRVGIDLEPMESGALAGELADRVFDGRELADYLALSEAERARRFVGAWTFKEAVLKALGTGFQVDPRAVELAWRGEGGASLVRVAGRVGDGTDWVLAPWAGPGGFAGAVALAPAGFAG